MNIDPTTATEIILVLLGFAVAAGALGWSPYGVTIWPPVAALLLTAAAVVAAVADQLYSTRVTTTVLVALCGLLAVAGGGPATTRIFTIIDRQSAAEAGSADGPPGRTSVTGASSVLRGGAWIGALERLAVFAGLASGFPGGVAVVLALKGVGRFPDLRGDPTGGAATERFIIGTFASVLWAAACAGMVALARR